MVPGSGGITGEVVVNVVQWRQPWSGAQPASESSRMQRKDSVTSAAVVSARSRGRAHRHHREELRRDGGAGAAASV